MPYERVLITGASGFIGSRLCEKFTLQYRLRYRALVRNFGRAARIARLGADLAGGDLQDPAALAAALSGCDAVVHLAYSDRQDAEEVLLAACRRAGIKRFIHISSMAVHGPNPGPECANEATATIGRYDDSYSNAKAHAERTVQRAIAQGFPAIILRPTVVYGPYSAFVTRVVESARSGAITLIDDGAGICNAVYVDDVCDAIHAALFSDRALGKAMFINADRAVTWREFNLTFARMASPNVDVRSIPGEQVRAYWAAQKPSLRSNIRALKRLAASSDFHDQLQTVPALRSAIRWSKATIKNILPAERLAKLRGHGGDVPATAVPASWPDKGRIVREDFHLEFSTALAKQSLEWKPAFDFYAGAALTRKWLEFAGMIAATPQCPTDCHRA